MIGKMAFLSDHICRLLYRRLERILQRKSYSKKYRAIDFTGSIGDNRIPATLGTIIALTNNFNMIA